jgi:hypothetical protein
MILVQCLLENENDPAQSWQADASMIDRFEALRAYLVALGDDVRNNFAAHTFKRIKNFACVEFRPTTKQNTHFRQSRSVNRADRAQVHAGMSQKLATSGLAIWK